jgi:hypothetical protein
MPGMGHGWTSVRDKSDQRLLNSARAALMILERQIDIINTENATLDTLLRKENKASEMGPRLETIPSVGPVITSRRGVGYLGEAVVAVPEPGRMLR